MLFSGAFWLTLRLRLFPATSAADCDFLAAGVSDFAPFYGELGGGSIELFCAEIEQGEVGSRSYFADVGRAARDAGAAARSAMIGHQGGVAFDHGETIDRDSEFFGCCLAKRRGETGSDIDFAGVDGDGTIGVDREEAIDFSRIDRLGGVYSLGAALCERAGLESAPGETYDEGASGLLQE